MNICEIKVLLEIYTGNEELVLKNAGGKKLADSNDYFVVTDDGICHLFDVNGTEKDISAITALTEDIISKDIKKIVIPNSVKSIGNDTFSCCYALTNVTIPDSVTSIGNWAFINCINLMSIMIPNSVTSIKLDVFYACSSLINVMIPDSVTSIGYQAFCWCGELTSMTIPNSVTSIGNWTFRGCNKLTNLSFKGKTLEEIKAMENYPFGVKDESVIKCIDEMHTTA